MEKTLESVDVDVAEQEGTVRAVAGQQKLEVVRHEPGETSILDVLHVDFRLGLGEEFVVVLPENRSDWRDRFEAVPVEMVG